MLHHSHQNPKLMFVNRCNGPYKNIISHHYIANETSRRTSAFKFIARETRHYDALEIAHDIGVKKKCAWVEVMNSVSSTLT